MTLFEIFEIFRNFMFSEKYFLIEKKVFREKNHFLFFYRISSLDCASGIAQLPLGRPWRPQTQPQLPGNHENSPNWRFVQRLVGSRGLAG